eukprot:gene8345-11289_t
MNPSFNEISVSEKGLLVAACFKLLYVRWHNGANLVEYQINHQPFPWQKAIEFDGTDMSFFSSRIRDYMAGILELPPENLPLFVHAVALFDAYQMKQSFIAWKKYHFKNVNLKYRSNLNRLRHYFSQWNEHIFGMLRLRLLFQRVEKQHKLLAQRALFKIWKLTCRVRFHVDYILKNRLICRSINDWVHYVLIRRYNSSSIQLANRHRMFKILPKVFNNWINKLSLIQDLSTEKLPDILRVMLLNNLKILLNNYNKNRNYVYKAIYNNSSDYKNNLPNRNASLDASVLTTSSMFSSPSIANGSEINYYTPNDNAYNNVEMPISPQMISSPFQRGHLSPLTLSDSGRNFDGDNFSPQRPLSPFKHRQSSKINLNTNSINSSFTENVESRGLKLLTLIKSNISHKKSQSILQLYGAQFRRYKSLIVALRYWVDRLPQIKLDKNNKNFRLLLKNRKFSSVHYSFNSVDPNSRYSNLSLLYKGMKRWVNGFEIRRQSKLKIYAIHRLVSNHILTKAYGAWVITAAHREHIRRARNRVIGNRMKTIQWHAWFAWRNQFERSILIKSNQTKVISMRSAEILQFTDSLNNQHENHTKSSALKMWSLLVRDRRRGKMIISVWNNTAGKRFLYFALSKWKTILGLDSIVNCLKTAWLGYKKKQKLRMARAFRKLFLTISKKKKHRVQHKTKDNKASKQRLLKASNSVNQSIIQRLRKNLLRSNDENALARALYKWLYATRRLGKIHRFDKRIIFKTHKNLLKYVFKRFRLYQQKRYKMKKIIKRITMHVIKSKKIKVLFIMLTRTRRIIKQMRAIQRYFIIRNRRMKYNAFNRLRRLAKNTRQMHRKVVCVSRLRKLLRSFLRRLRRQILVRRIAQSQSYSSLLYSASVEEMDDSYNRIHSIESNHIIPSVQNKPEDQKGYYDIMEVILS